MVVYFLIKCVFVACYDNLPSFAFVIMNHAAQIKSNKCSSDPIDDYTSRAKRMFTPSHNDVGMTIFQKGLEQIQAKFKKIPDSQLDELFSHQINVLSLNQDHNDTISSVTTEMMTTPTLREAQDTSKTEAEVLEQMNQSTTDGILGELLSVVNGRGGGVSKEPIMLNVLKIARQIL